MLNAERLTNIHTSLSLTPKATRVNPAGGTPCGTLSHETTIRAQSGVTIRSDSVGDDCASNRSVRPWRTDELGDDMKRWIVGTAITLGLAIVAFLGVIGYTAVGRTRGESWSSFTGPEPVWPAVVGFGVMYLIPMAAVLLVVLVATAVVRAYIPRSTAPR